MNLELNNLTLFKQTKTKKKLFIYLKPTAGSYSLAA